MEENKKEERKDGQIKIASFVNSRHNQPRNAYIQSLRVDSRNQKRKEYSHTKNQRSMHNKANTTKRKTYKEKNSSKLKNILKKLRVILILGGAAFATPAVSASYKNSIPISISQAKEIGYSPEELAIDSGLEKELAKISDSINNSATNKELFNISEKINELQIDTLKGKLANALNTNAGNITLVYKPGDPSPIIYISVDEQGNYEPTFFKIGNSIDSNIKNYIDKIAQMQYLINDEKYHNINRDYMIKQCKSAIDGLNKCAASKISIDKKGNLKMDYTTKKEFKNISKEKNLDDKDYR